MSPSKRDTEEPITLREYLAERLEGLEHLIVERFDSLSREVDKVERGFDRQIGELSKSTSERFDQVNIYKETTRKMLETQHATLEARLRIVEQQIANWQGRLVVIAAIWGIVSVALSVLINFFVRTLLG